jgi:hypothetical protein
MPSAIEKERKAILERLNTQGRILERQSPALAEDLNAKLSQVVEWLATMISAARQGDRN